MGAKNKQRIKENYQKRIDSLKNAIKKTKLNKAEATSDMIGGITNAVGGMMTASGLGGGGSNAASKAAKAAEPAFVQNSLSNTVGSATAPAADLNRHVQGLSYDGPMSYEKRTL